MDMTITMHLICILQSILNSTPIYLYSLILRELKYLLFHPLDCSVIVV